MNSTLSKIIIFAAGAVLGSLATWKVVETKYKRLADEEIASVKKTYSEQFAPKKFEPKEFTPEKFETKEYDEHEELVTELGYTNYENIRKEKAVSKPHIIPPEEYGEKDEYETESLTYYADGVLTDDQDNPIEDVDNVVGYGFESHFGEYEDDSVFVRNDRLKIDYEILADQRNYSDINKKQRPTEGK